MSDTPIEDYLDELLRRTHADARSTRRLLDEAGDHLHAAAADLEASGLSRQLAEVEAIRRFGPAAPVALATSRRSLVALFLETLRAALFLAGCGLAAVGVSGLVALVMNLWFGRSFVGGVSVVPFQPGASVAETADDAVVLRALAGLVGLLVLLAYWVVRRRASSASLLPAGLVDALGAAAFAAGTAGLTIAAVDQAAHGGADGVGFPLSGALVALPATLYFCIRAARALLRPVS
ncbi:MAG TPA: permease prefix domain 1-containing protein [Jatrophihabitans sp.]|nr:permease prefix domain 1-containing protein [Jatrophihabitans sp.]